EAGALDGARELALLLGGYRRDPAWHDLAALGDVTLQEPYVLVVDLGRVGAGERTGLAAAEERPAGLRLGRGPWPYSPVASARPRRAAAGRQGRGAARPARDPACRRARGRESRSPARPARGRGRPCASSPTGPPRARRREW